MSPKSLIKLFSKAEGLQSKFSHIHFNWILLAQVAVYDVERRLLYICLVAQLPVRGENECQVCMREDMTEGLARKKCGTNSVQENKSRFKSWWRGLKLCWIKLCVSNDHVFSSSCFPLNEKESYSQYQPCVFSYWVSGRMEEDTSLILPIPLPAPVFLPFQSR